MEREIDTHMERERAGQREREREIHTYTEREGAGQREREQDRE